MANADLPVIDAYMGWITSLSTARRRALVPNGSEWAVEDFRAAWARSDGADLLDRLLDVNLRTYLLDDLLPKVDRMAMAHALEVRSPFLDRELVEWAVQLPRPARVRGLVLKRVLKAALEDLLPRDILHRRKHGFGAPLARWFRSDLRAYVEGALGSTAASIRAHVDGDALDQLLHEHQAGHADHGDALWNLLALEVFLRREGW